MPPRQERANERGNEYSARDFGPAPDFDDDPRAAREHDFDHEPPRNRARRRAEVVTAEPEDEDQPPRRPIGKLVALVVVGLVLLGIVGGVAWPVHCSTTGRGDRMAAMKPRTGDGPLEVTKEGRGIVMRVPLEGGGRLVVELTPDEAKALSGALESAVG